MKNIDLRALAGLVTAAALTACGGGGSTPAASNAGTTTYATVLAQLATQGGLTSSTNADAFDDAYLDSGMTKAQVIDALNQEAAALGASAQHSLFPQVTLTDAQLTGCDANNVCTLTGTIVNADADSTSVPFSTKVVNVNGTYRLLGDQLAS